MILAIAVGLTAGLGAVVRYVADQVIQHRYDGVFPLGTLTVNLVGSLLLGLVTGLAAHHGLPTGPTVVLSAGFCSGFTTWSTYAYESLALADAGSPVLALGNAVGSLAGGLGAAAVGLGLTLR